ncbi:LysR family transcriptional regulator [Rhizobium sp. Root482]|uniref:LysR family transcriptional regulator n=1 Tax=Rhizobium sp. Root482 TaxID=1736543 RepID=UPI0006F20675|nr:LysR family transcriptional regulator [Rhizobium sp. Root482]KQY15411.1 LysR family transcriptional regulator [Rhizobium sp. Root482]
MPDLPLTDLDAFAAVARERSFRAAARLRGVSASSLSQAVRRLEQRCGVRLFNRTTRSVTLTEAGERLMDRLSPALGELVLALDQLNSFRDRVAGTLRLNVPTVVARMILPDIAAEFLNAYPDITLEISGEDRFIDVLAAGFDAGVRYDERLEKDMIAVPIGPRVQRFVTAAAPSYLAGRGCPHHPREMLDHVAIRHRFLSGIVPPWEFEKDGESLFISPPACMISNVIDLEIDAAVAGLGIIRTFEEFLAPFIDRGELVPILGDWASVFPGPSLYYASRRHMPAPLRAFIDFVKLRARQG